MTSPMIAHPARALSGECTVPGDKSISHRSMIFGGLAKGRTTVTGLLEAEDVMRTAAAVRALGAKVEKNGDVWEIDGAEWQEPERVLYCGNAGTGSRLLMGAVAGQGVAAAFDGDRSLRSRPMGRILNPLAEMGVTSDSDEGRLPVQIHAGQPNAIRFRLPKPSAQIKSAVILAALGAEGATVIEEPIVSRDHTERMLPAFGVPVGIEPMDEGGRTVTINGPATLTGTNVIVPADPSSAAFPVAAGLVVPGSELLVKRVLMNPFRTGLYEVLEEMGADITKTNESKTGEEPVADLLVRHGKLRGVTVSPDRAPSMIDEYPILAVIAATAEGTTRMEGLAELRVKESDRLAATEAMLRENGVTVRSGDDWLEVDGGPIKGGGLVETHDDHRIAMSGIVLGFAAQSLVTIDDGDMIATSFTGFKELMGSLGAVITEPSIAA